MMPISKFAIEIAHALADYLSKDNTALLPTAYEYGKDESNKALLNPYTASNLTRTATGYAASAAKGAVSSAMVSFGFWAPTPPPQTPPAHSFGSTPSISSTMSIPGLEGINRAIKIAKVFGLLEEEGRGDALVDILKTEGEGRRSGLMNEGFNAINPSNRYINDIIQADCDRILTFLTHPQKWYQRTSGRRVLAAIQGFLRITEAQVQQERQELDNAFIETPDNQDDEEGYDIIGTLHSTLDETQAPPEFCVPEMALHKLIYEKAYALKTSLQNEVLTPIDPLGSVHSTHSYRNDIRSPTSPSSVSISGRYARGSISAMSPSSASSSSSSSESNRSRSNSSRHPSFSSSRK